MEDVFTGYERFRRMDWYLFCKGFISRESLRAAYGMARNKSLNGPNPARDPEV